jgi:hypothetical protein
MGLGFILDSVSRINKDRGAGEIKLVDGELRSYYPEKRIILVGDNERLVKYYVYRLKSITLKRKEWIPGDENRAGYWHYYWDDPIEFDKIPDYKKPPEIKIENPGFYDAKEKGISFNFGLKEKSAKYMDFRNDIESPDEQAEEGFKAKYIKGLVVDARGIEYDKQPVHATYGDAAKHTVMKPYEVLGDIDDLLPLGRQLDKREQWLVMVYQKSQPTVLSYLLKGLSGDNKGDIPPMLTLSYVEVSTRDDTLDDVLEVDEEAGEVGESDKLSILDKLKGWFSSGPAIIDKSAQPFFNANPVFSPVSKVENLNLLLTEDNIGKSIEKLRDFYLSGDLSIDYDVVNTNVQIMEDFFRQH